MSYNDKKFLDINGLKHLISILDDYPTNEVLGTVINAIESEIPTNVSQLQNDAGYLTTHQDISGKADNADLAAVATSGDYDDLINKPTIPEVPVTDVQVNGTSILSSGVANVPVASASTYGTVRFSTDYGLQNIVVSGNQRLGILAASTAEEKTGTNNFKPVVPSHQHEATFYGLAKVAGADLANEANISVGTYTDAAKTAIQNMLGITSLLSTEESSTATTAHALNSTFMMNGKLHRATAAIAVGDAVEVGTNCEVVKADEVFVKKTDYASAGEPGVMKVWNTYGVFINNSGNLTIWPANSNEIKLGEHNYRPIIPANQHESVFYGLAKAAGDTTQSISTNTVGTYTDEAKLAIKDMLGITQTLTVTVLTQDNVTVTGQTVTVRADDAAGEVYATAAYEGQPVSFALPTGFQYYVSVSDTLAHHFNPTTARGIVTDTDVAVTLIYSDLSTIHTATDIKAALNAGMDLTDLVGEQITCTKSGETLTWDVVDYDSTNDSIMLLLHDAFGTANMVFEPAQVLIWCENGLAVGSYTFTWNTTQCYFTLTIAIPAGGQLRATNSQFQTYASQDATTTLETGTVGTDEITGATDLGHEGQGLLNHRDRVNYGSNNFAESALFWWLNSDVAANTPRVPVTKFSRAYSYAQPGFMNGLDPDFVNCLDVVDWLCSTNNVYECPESLGGYTKGIKQAYTVKAKFGLASEMEIFGSYGGNPDGSTVFDLYNGADADDRKKYRGTSAQVWWLRSPIWSYAYNERFVSSSGGASSSTAGNSFAVVPACRISRDSEVNE